MAGSLRLWAGLSSQQVGEQLQVFTVPTQAPKTHANIPRGPQHPQTLPLVYRPSRGRESRAGWLRPLLLPSGPGCIPSEPGPAKQVNKFSIRVLSQKLGAGKDILWSRMAHPEPATVLHPDPL